jgi:lipoprotein NlpD
VSTTPPPASTTPIPATQSRPASPIASGLSWRWPTRGQLVGRYVSGDQTRQGIDIAGTAGQRVDAAADGVVVYSGAGLVGYGELVIVKHNDEWLSAYAHNRRRLVAEGTKVKAGDAIAEMGRTGAIRDMLHFEIRRNGKPVDPLQLLPNRSD